MHIFLFAPEENGISYRLKEAIDQKVSVPGLEIINDLDLFIPKLKQINKDSDSIYILLATNKKALQELSSIKPLLGDVPKILILPDKDKSTISEGHSFFPKYVSYTDGDFSDVALVLEKMINNIQTKGVAV